MFQFKHWSNCFSLFCCSITVMNQLHPVLQRTADPLSKKWQVCVQPSSPPVDHGTPIPPFPPWMNQLHPVLQRTADPLAKKPKVCVQQSSPRPVNQRTPMPPLPPRWRVASKDQLDQLQPVLQRTSDPLAKKQQVCVQPSSPPPVDQRTPIPPLPPRRRVASKDQLDLWTLKLKKPQDCVQPSSPPPEKKA